MAPALHKLSQEGREFFGSPVRHFHIPRKNLSCSPHRDIKSKKGSNSSFSGVEFFGTAKVRRKFEKSSKISQKIIHYSGVTIVYYKNTETPVNKGFSGSVSLYLDTLA